MRPVPGEPADHHSLKGREYFIAMRIAFRALTRCWAAFSVLYTHDICVHKEAVKQGYDAPFSRRGN